MAQDLAGFQSHGVVAGELEDDRAGRGAHRENLENAIALVALEAPDLDRRHPVEGDAGQGALAMSLLVEGRALPHEAVDDQDEALLVGQEGHLGDRHQRILQKGRNDGEILRVLGTQLELAGCARRAARIATWFVGHPAALLGLAVPAPLDLGAAGPERILEPLIAGIALVDPVDEWLAPSPARGANER